MIYKKLTVRGITLVCTLLAAVASAGFLILLYFVTGNVQALLIGFVFCLVLCALLIAALAIVQKKVSEFSKDLCYTLDKMIDGTATLPWQLESETLLSRVVHKLNQLFDILQEQQLDINDQKQALQEVITDIAHQSQTPVANLKMVIATIMDPDLPEPKKTELITAMDCQLDKLKFLMESMAKMARLEAGIFTVNKSETPIFETIADAVGPLFLAAEKKQLHIEVSCDGGLILNHDKRWTAEAVFNILENAVKYTDEGGHINVDVTRQEMFTKISVTDDGKGIAEKYHSRIFKRFYREQDVHHIPGLGVGLYLSRKIITLQGGYIMVESSSGAGSGFHIYLPNK